MDGEDFFRRQLEQIEEILAIPAEFPVAELATWLEVARLRWSCTNLTARLEGTGLNIYQDGRYRGAIELNTPHPMILHWADDDA